jgi:hypothetical protein
MRGLPRTVREGLDKARDSALIAVVTHKHVPVLNEGMLVDFEPR